MNQSVSLRAVALSALLAGACLPAHARQVPGGPTVVQTPAQAADAKRAEHARQAAQSYLNREEAAATRSQADQTDKANRDAAVHDETSGAAENARPARKGANPNAAAAAGASGSRGATGSPPPAYGPVLTPRQPPQMDPNRKDPAEVHDETDSGVRQAPPSGQQQKPRQSAARRHPAWQAAQEPMAPRPLRAGEEPVAGTGMVPVAPPAAAPRPVVPSNTPMTGCVGSACTDAAGTSYNFGSMPGSAGVSSAGRLCSRGSLGTVQCN